MTWLEELHDEIALLEEHTDNAEPIAWARWLEHMHGREGAIEAVLASNCPPAVRRVALEELAL